MHFTVCLSVTAWCGSLEHLYLCFSFVLSGDDLTSGYSSGDPDNVDAKRRTHPSSSSSQSQTNLHHSLNQSDEDAFYTDEESVNEDDYSAASLPPPLPPPQTRQLPSKKLTSKVRRTQSMTSNAKPRTQTATRRSQRGNTLRQDLPEEYDYYTKDDLGLPDYYSSSGQRAANGAQGEAGFKRSRPGEVSLSKKLFVHISWAIIFIAFCYCLLLYLF